MFKTLLVAVFLLLIPVAGIAQTADSTLGDFEYAMTISAKADAALPFVMGMFEAAYEDSAMVLRWETFAERNNARFEVERSMRTHEGGQSAWSTMMFIAGNGTVDSLSTYEFRDKGTMAGATQVYYRLKQVSFDGSNSYSETVEATLPAPESFAASSYPDAYVPAATIEYDLPKTGRVRLTVYDEGGRHIKTLINKTEKAGRYRVVFDASDQEPGLYMYRLEAAGNVWFEPMLLIR